MISHLGEPQRGLRGTVNEEGVVGHATQMKKKYSGVWEERQLNNFSKKYEWPSGRTSRNKLMKKLQETTIR